MTVRRRPGRCWNRCPARSAALLVRSSSFSSIRIRISSNLFRHRSTYIVRRCRRRCPATASSTRPHTASRRRRRCTPPPASILPAAAYTRRSRTCTRRRRCPPPPETTPASPRRRSPVPPASLRAQVGTVSKATRDVTYLHQQICPE